MARVGVEEVGYNPLKRIRIGYLIKLIFKKKKKSFMAVEI